MHTLLRGEYVARQWKYELYTSVLQQCQLVVLKRTAKEECDFREL